MKRWMIFAPVAGLAVFAAVLGLRLGGQPSETDIINRYAAAYLATAGVGAKPTDCAATTHPDPAVRMVVTCSHASGVVTTFFVGRRGETLPFPDQGEPTT
ncbi:hypothetical protein [Yoonia sp.]|uniref:hypothetical protein n=1 Tax=Yoonia sp. TaxID=2212373 RepID=UPI0025ECCD83|nr:hypothetical protein [Yoonia sp.]